MRDWASSFSISNQLQIYTEDCKNGVIIYLIHVIGMLKRVLPSSLSYRFSHFLWSIALVDEDAWLLPERTQLLLFSNIQFYWYCLHDVGQHVLITQINCITLFNPYSTGTLVFGLPVVCTCFEMHRKKAPSIFDICDCVSQQENYKKITFSIFPGVTYMNDTTRIRQHSPFLQVACSLAPTESRLQRERGQQEGAPPAHVCGTVKFDAFATSLCFFFSFFSYI